MCTVCSVVLLQADRERQCLDSLFDWNEMAHAKDSTLTERLPVTNLLKQGSFGKGLWGPGRLYGTAVVAQQLLHSKQTELV